MFTIIVVSLIHPSSEEHTVGSFPAKLMKPIYVFFG